MKKLKSKFEYCPIKLRVLYDNGYWQTYRGDMFIKNGDENAMVHHLYWNVLKSTKPLKNGSPRPKIMFCRMFDNSLFDDNIILEYDRIKRPDKAITNKLQSYLSNYNSKYEMMTTNNVSMPKQLNHLEDIDKRFFIKK